MKTNKLYIIPATLVTTTMLTGLVLSSTITKADGNTNVTDTVSITVDSACTMTGGPTGESTTDNTYTATIDPGTYSEISGSKLVTVCNDNLGYSIYAIMPLVILVILMIQILIQTLLVQEVLETSKPEHLVLIPTGL